MENQSRKKISRILAAAAGCLVLCGAPLLRPAPAEAAALPQGEEAGPLAVTLNYDIYEMEAGDVLQLTADAGPGASVVWSSDAESVATVSETGAVTAVSGGRALIAATVSVETEAGMRFGEAYCEIFVRNVISLDKGSLELYAGEYGQLSAVAKPASAVLWESSNTNVAEAYADGRVLARGQGHARITATANGVSASCDVTVKAPFLSLPSKATAYLKNPIKLEAEAAPATGVKWKSSNNKVATVSGGRVTPRKVGKATITAEANGIKKSCVVTVKKPVLKFEKKSVLIFAKTPTSLGLTARPEGNVKLTSSKPGVVRVGKDGMVTGIKTGKAKITASLPGTKKVSCKVTVIGNPYKLSRTSLRMVKGSSATIYMKEAGADDSFSFTVDGQPGVVDLSCQGASCTVKARKEGTAKIHASCTAYVEGDWVTCRFTCKVRVIPGGVVQQQASIAANTSRALKLRNIEKEGASVRGTSWKSSNPQVASVGRNGVVRGKKRGSARITATVRYSDGTSREFPTNLRVSNPTISSSYSVVTVGKRQKIKLEGINAYSDVKWKVKKASVASLTPDGVIQAGKSTGETKVTVTVDGRRISHKIIVTDPQLEVSFKALAPNTPMRILLTGTSSKSRISFKSLNPGVASVNPSGLVTGIRYGSAGIAVTADGTSLEFEADIAPQRAVNACQAGYGIINSSRYSQALRMSQGYYDCSSLVFRAYGCDTALLGGIPSWAPTAASMAAYLEQHGKVISYGGLDESKLLPGDLIFYSQSSGNGRYRNIYHVSMYYGGGYRLEKPLRVYYPESNIAMIARPVR